MASIEEITVGIATYTELLSVLAVNNDIFLKGQLVWAIDDVSGSNKKGLKVGDFDKDTMAEGAGTPFNDLDWVIKPENAGADGFTPFPIERTDPQFAEVGSDTVITDDRLKGVTTFLVYSTERNAHFRKNEKTINSTLGKITLIGYTGMGTDDQLLIFIPAAVVVSADLTDLETRIAKLEIYTRPISVGGAIWIWKRPLINIPTEYQEVTELRGKTIIGHLSTDDDFTPVWTKTGGAKAHNISGTNFLPRFRLFTIVNELLGPIVGHPVDVGRAVSAVRSLIKAFSKSDGGGKESYDTAGASADTIEPTLSPTSWVGQESPDDINHLNPYRIVHFIELKPEYLVS
jgi:hypothetical protein